MTAGMPDSESSLAGERAYILRLCTWLTRDPDSAEDLAQETLVVAWRHAHTLRDPEKRMRWLAGIARNICRRWSRQRCRDLAHSLGTDRLDASLPEPFEELLADPFDLEIELERAELAMLLDRALSLLPADTRTVLVERYIEGSPHAEVAARLGLSVGAVAKRLERGKLLLKRVLITHFRDDAASYGLIDAQGWQTTRIWCPICGQNRLIACSTPDSPELTFRCPSCSSVAGLNVAHGIGDDIFGGVRTFRPALGRMQRWAHIFYRDALRRGTAVCPDCGRANSVRLPQVYASRPWWRMHPIELTCAPCGYTMHSSLAALTLCLPEAQRFWRANPRMRTYPARELDIAGRPALLTTFVGLTIPARLDVISARDTYEVLSIAESEHSERLM